MLIDDDGDQVKAKTAWQHGSGADPLGLMARRVVFEVAGCMLSRIGRDARSECWFGCGQTSRFAPVQRGVREGYPFRAQ